MNVNNIDVRKVSKDFHIQLTRHACTKLTHHLNVPVAEFRKHLDKASRSINILNDYTATTFPLWVQEEYLKRKAQKSYQLNELLLYVGGVDMLVVCNVHLDTGITVVNKNGTNEKKSGRKHAYQQFQTSRDLSHIVDGTRIEIRNKGKYVEIWHYKTHLFNMDKVYDSEFNYNWKGGFGKLYPSSLQTNTFTLDVMFDSDRFGRRMVFRDVNGNASGNAHTHKDRRRHLKFSSKDKI